MYSYTHLPKLCTFPPLFSQGTMHVGDGVKWVSDYRLQVDAARFDFVVHDVFTGGAMPASLFTTEFFRDIQACLLPVQAVAS